MQWRWEAVAGAKLMQDVLVLELTGINLSVQQLKLEAHF